MDYRYSRLIDSATYHTDGLAFGIPLRMHLNPQKESSGALKAQEDWDKQVAPLRGYLGGLGPMYGFISVTIPECRPERLEIMSYANEYAFLYDDEMEKLELKSQSVGESKILDAFSLEGALHYNVELDTRPEKRLQAQIFTRMTSIDPVRAVTSMKAWAMFVQLASRTRVQPFEIMAEYLPSRIVDAGELFWYGTLTFAMALTIPEHELELCFSLGRPGYSAISLTNDLYSWKKEKRAAEDAGLDYVFNAIWVLMTERAITEQEAIEVCREKIIEDMSSFNATLEDLDTRKLSRDTVTYLQAVRSSYIGNLIWSIYCPRYRECV